MSEPHNLSEKVCQIRGEIGKFNDFDGTLSSFNRFSPSTCFEKLRPWFAAEFPHEIPPLLVTPARPFSIGGGTSAGRRAWLEQLLTNASIFMSTSDCTRMLRVMMRLRMSASGGGSTLTPPSRC